MLRADTIEGDYYLIPDTAALTSAKLVRTSAGAVDRFDGAAEFVG